MIINPHLEPHIVDDYDISFDNGLSMSITVDKEAGDTIDWTTSPLVVQFHAAAKPSVTDPDTLLPAEDTTIFLSHVLSISHRCREVMPRTPDQDIAFKTLHKLSSTVQ
jgi:hypothetical protein